MATVHISRVTGGAFAKLKSFGLLAPYAISWYVLRFIRQSFFNLFLRVFGKHIFRKIGKNVIIDGFPEVLWPCADIRLSDNVRIGKRCVFQGSPSSKIVIGENVTINDGCYITSLFEIRIGKNTSIGEYTSIRDYNHEFDNLEKTIKEQDYIGAPILIGKNCWIGRGCIILPGVEIGDGAVIGANCVVNKSIPANTIAAGVPVKLIRKRGNEK